ncbi:MAG: PDZ domain-containing protein [Lachnospiraceae bacterium]|nr:PDZ domain-containing protein [Lachnospiraceae bacterium]
MSTPGDLINSTEKKQDSVQPQPAEAPAENTAAGGKAPSGKGEPDDSYPVIRETVKRRPVKYRKILQKILAITAGAVLFGIVAAFVFSRFLPVFNTSGEGTVQFEQDSAPAVTSPGDITEAVTQGAEETQIPEATPEDGETESSGTEESAAAENTESQETEPELTETAAPENPEDSSGENSENTLEPNEVPGITPTPSVDPAFESAERIRQNRMLYNDFRTLSVKTAKSVVTVTGITTTEDWFNTTSEERHQTSGVIVADNGVSYLVLAQYEAIADSTSLYVTLFNNAIVECSVVKEDANTGLAVLRVQKNNIDPAVRGDLQIAVLGNSYNIGNGEPVIAIGAPMGYTGSIDYGQVTSISGKISVMDAAYSLIMTNIQGTPGGSGVLINLDGEVIGIISQQFAQGTNTVTALPISPLKRTVEILSNNQKFAWLGIVGEDVTSRLSASFSIPVGIYVTEVAPDSPAFDAGIQRGDIICRIGETPVTEMAALGSLLNNGMAGTTQTVTVQRLGADGYVEIGLDVSIGEI